MTPEEQDTLADDHCSLCESLFDRDTDASIIEVLALGSTRRVHERCWHEVGGTKANAGEWIGQVLSAILESEDTRGITEWHQGLPARDGMAKFTHLVRSPCDPEASSREERRKRAPAEDPNDRWKRLTWRVDVDKWKAMILELLVDGRPRTFNAICVEAADITADVVFGKNPDEALWALVAAHILQWSSREPVRFRINPQLPQLELGSTYTLKRSVEGSTTVEVAAIGYAEGSYWYTARGDKGNAWDQWEAALVSNLKLEQL